MHSFRWRDKIYPGELWDKIEAKELERSQEWVPKYVSLKNHDIKLVVGHSNVREHKKYLPVLFHEFPIECAEDFEIKLWRAFIVHDRWEVPFIDISQSKGKTPEDREEESIALNEAIETLYSWDYLKIVKEVIQELTTKWELYQALKVYEEMSHLDGIIALREAGHNIEEWAEEEHINNLLKYWQELENCKSVVINYLQKRFPWEVFKIYDVNEERQNFVERLNKKNR